MISEDEKLHVTRVGRDGRRWYDPSWKARLVSASFGRGVSVSRLALDHGINANLLRKWIKSFQESGLAPLPASSAFIPVHVTGAVQSPARVSSELDMRGWRGQEKPLMLSSSTSSIVSKDRPETKYPMTAKRETTAYATSVSNTAFPS